MDGDKSMIGRLHVITDFFFQQIFSHCELAEYAILGGADIIQFRQKRGGVRHRLLEAQRVADAMHESTAKLIINDDIMLMQAIDASGVHLGQTDYPVRAARNYLGTAATIGVTVTTLSEALEAENDNADYIGFGPIFQTRSKSNPASVKGLDALELVCSAVSIPVIAIGGIKEKYVRSILDAGAYGIAIMTAVTLAPDPQASTRKFRNEIDAFLADAE